MPLEELLAIYRYEPPDSITAGSSVDSSPSELADDLPDMTLDKVIYLFIMIHVPAVSCYFKHLF